MRILKESIGSIFIISIGVLLTIVTLPLIILISPFYYFRRRKFEKEYSDFLNELNGKNFFCYNNRKNSKQFIEEAIIPDLSKDIDIIYLNGRKIESKYPKEFISAILNNLKAYRKFPHLAKVRDGKLHDKSINNIFYSVLKQHTPKSKLLREINHFFDLAEDKKNNA
nr:hypothetical protein [uncultured Flavobacterium sp.]